MDPFSPVRQPLKLVLSLSFWLIICSSTLAQDTQNPADAASADFEIQLTKRLEGHTGPIYSIVYSPDQMRIVSAGGIFNTPGEFIVWDAPAGSEKLRFTGHQGPVYGLAYSPEGSQFASAGSDGTIRVWDANTGTEIRSLGGHTGEAYCVLFSRDGSLLISGGGTQDQPGEVIIRNAATGEELRRLNGHIGSVLSLAISTDGKLLASGGLDEIIRIWNLQSGELVKEIPGHTGRISSIAFGPGQDELLSSSSDRTLRRWNVQTAEQIDALVNNDRGQPSMELHHTAVNRFGDLIATAASNKFVYLWDQKGTKLASLPGHTLASKCVAFSPNGEQLASAGADRTILLWELPTAAPLPLFGRSSNPHTPVTLRTAANWVVASDVSSDGRLVATGDNTNAVVVVDVMTQEIVFQLKGHTGWVTDVSFSPDGRWLASASYDKSVVIWDMQTGKEEFRWSTLTTVMTCDFSPDSMWIACNSGTGPEGREISVWEALTGTNRFTLAKHGSTVMDLTFSPDGTKLASASNDGTVILWDMINGIDLATFRGLKNGRPNNLWSAAFSPDGKVLAAAGRHEQIYLWDIETQEPIHTIDVDRGGIHDLVFTPDGKWLISSSGEFQSHGEIMVWDPVSGDSILAIPAHTDRTKSIALSPRGDWLISTSDDKTVKLWNIGAAISQASQKTADNTEP